MATFNLVREWGWGGIGCSRYRYGWSMATKQLGGDSSRAIVDVDGPPLPADRAAGSAGKSRIVPFAVAAVYIQADSRAVCEWVEHYVSEGAELIYLADFEGRGIPNVARYRTVVRVVTSPTEYRPPRGAGGAAHFDKRLEFFKQWFRGFVLVARRATLLFTGSGLP